VRELSSPDGPYVLAAAATLLEAIWLICIASVALLLNARRPANRVGWLLAVLGPMLALVSGAFSYRMPTPTSWGVGFVWLTTVAAFYALALGGPILALLFPDGHLPSRRWRMPVTLVTATFATGVLLLSLAPGRLAEMGAADLVRLTDAGRLASFGVRLLAPVADLLTFLTFAGLIALVAEGIGAVVARRRRGAPVVKAQLRWFLLAASLIAVGFASIFAEVFIGSPSETPFGVIFLFLGFALTPIAIAIAILRHRLYDIDVIIRRTLVYGTLTVSLGGAYVASVLMLQAALGRFTQADGLAIAVSTLAVASFFQPVRRRIQRSVDRRFFRSRYDAQRTTEAFAARLRAEVDLVRLTDELGAVAAEALQPASVSVWLRRP
jgi:hypothetical protein